MPKRDRSSTRQIRVDIRRVIERLDAIRQRERRTPESYPYGRIIEDLAIGRVDPLPPRRPPEPPKPPEPRS